ncbi:hypothetical protein GUJ93_ZPchr0003g17459 [Zizania palustris]|uniref:Secreted protein n=1 Tax=Zizania palustris TaxID=103762 RepID=A0A8J5S6H4_ZIZPA|nr:hypothetical protein GUJ93_ZPchr0003g17459 [Zizania palustris]
MYLWAVGVGLLPPVVLPVAGLRTVPLPQLLSAQSPAASCAASASRPRAALQPLLAAAAACRRFGRRPAVPCARWPAVAAGCDAPTRHRRLCHADCRGQRQGCLVQSMCEALAAN